MVAEFITRQSGSPINGETACLNAQHGMPSHDSHASLPQQPQQQSQQHQSQHQSSHQSQQHQSPHQSQQHQSQQQQQQQQHQIMDQATADMYGQGGASNGSSCSNGSQSSYELRKELFSQRKQREFIPDNKKDDSYWDRRRRNNEAAKRSREKRRFNDMVLEQRVMELSKENHILKAQLDAIREKYNICVESVVSPEHVLAALPSAAAEPGLVKRAKLQSAAAAAAAAALLYARSPSPVHTSVIHQPVSMTGARSLRSPAAQHYAAPHPQPHQPQQPHQPHQQTQDELHYSHQQHQQHQPHQPHQPHQLQQQHSQQPLQLQQADFPAYPHFSQPQQQQQQQQPAGGFEAGAAALNLSARSRSPAFSQHEHDLSSSAGSGDEAQALGLRASPLAQQAAAAAAAAAALALQLAGPNSGLPHKLRHKSRLGDKDAASALLALQGIKQEPNAARASPPWDNEGSSDERDSGISLGAEWPPAPGHPGHPGHLAPASQQQQQQQHTQQTALPMPESEREVKSRLDRLASEVASLQSILRLSKVGLPVDAHI